MTSTNVRNARKPSSAAVYLDVIGTPVHLGQRKEGVKNGPYRMRDAGILENIRKLGVRLYDCGDISFDSFPDDVTVSNIRNPRAVGAAGAKISEAVKDSLSHGHLCLTLGGDHSLAIGSIHGHAQVDKDLAVIWVDAHADINPPLESQSGNAHGMPLAFLVKQLQDLIPKDLPEIDWLQPCLSTKDIAYIGLRDVDDAEKEILANHNITAFFMEDVKKHGIVETVKMALDAVSPNLSRPIHLSFDIDALDAAVAPSTGTAVADGLSLADGVYIVETVAATGQLRVMDIAEVNPELGTAHDQELTLKAANDVILGWFSTLTRSKLQQQHQQQQQQQIDAVSSRSLR